MTNWNTSTSRSATFRFFLCIIGRLPCCSHRHRHISTYGLGHVQPSLHRQPSSSATHPVDQALPSCLADLHSTDHGHVPKNGVNTSRRLQKPRDRSGGETGPEAGRPPSCPGRPPPLRVQSGLCFVGDLHRPKGSRITIQSMSV